MGSWPGVRTATPSTIGVTVQVLAAVGAAALVGAWVAALRAHLRRQRRSADWTGAQQRPDLWTSSARCRGCGARGGVLEEHDGDLWHVCLRCGERSPRRTRG